MAAAPTLTSARVPHTVLVEAFFLVSWKAPGTIVHVAVVASSMPSTLVLGMSTGVHVPALVWAVMMIMSECSLMAMVGHVELKMAARMNLAISISVSHLVALASERRAADRQCLQRCRLPLLVWSVELKMTARINQPISIYLSQPMALASERRAADRQCLQRCRLPLPSHLSSVRNPAICLFARGGLGVVLPTRVMRTLPASSSALAIALLEVIHVLITVLTRRRHAFSEYGYLSRPRTMAFVDLTHWIDGCPKRSLG